MEDKRLKQLLDRYRYNRLSIEEQAELDEWYHSLNFKEKEFNVSNSEKDLLYADFRQKLNTTRKFTTIRTISKYAAAAVILLFISAGLWFMKDGPKPQIAKTVREKELIQPGGNKAYLTLADGSKISLTDAPDGAIATQSGIKVTKAKDGQLLYEIVATEEKKAEATFNTISTPRGGQYQVVLPDGSRAWLNAASSLKYPTRFKGSERRVELEGEGYFEITHQAGRPFKVISNKQVVEVFGTHFNVNAYADEKSVVTTLLEGSVRVLSSGGRSQLIKPGQQVALTAHGELKVSAVNTDLSVAWKEGRFIFQHEELESVMRKIGRWYDVEIEYENGIPQKTVWGNVSRFDNVSDILELIELSKVAKFKYRGRRIIVMK